MKIEQRKKSFEPVTVTFETEKELLIFAATVRHPEIYPTEFKALDTLDDILGVTGIADAADALDKKLKEHYDQH